MFVLCHDFDRSIHCFRLVGRCLDREVLQPQLFLDKTSTRLEVCTQYVQNLTSIWKNNEDEDISTYDYDEPNRLLENARFAPEKDKALFWTGVSHELRNDYSNRKHRFTLVDQTPGGSLLIDLTYCSHNYYDNETRLCFEKSNQPWDDNLNNGTGGYRGASMAWWQGASREFAKAASGHTYVLFHKQRQYPTLYSQDSIFSRVEVNHLDPARVSTLEFLLTNEIGLDDLETCRGETIKNLTNRFIERGFKQEQIICNEDTWRIKALFCINRDDPMCDTFENLNAIYGSRKNWMVSSIVGWTLLGLVIILLTFWRVKVRAREHVESNADRIVNQVDLENNDENFEPDNPDDRSNGEETNVSLAVGVVDNDLNVSIEDVRGQEIDEL